MQWQYNNRLQPAYRMSYLRQSMLAVPLPHPSGGYLSPFHAGKITDMRVLMDELSTITQWHLLGIYLGVDLSILATIKADHEDTKERRIHTLIQWWNRVTPTWSAVVKALVGIGREKLASHVAEKHGMDYIWLTSYPLFTILRMASSSLHSSQESPFQTGWILYHWRK